MFWEESREKKERKNRYSKLEADKEYLYTLKFNCKGRTIGKTSKGINVEKIIVSLKIKIKKRRKGNLHRTAKAQCRGKGL